MNVGVIMLDLKRMRESELDWYSARVFIKEGLHYS